MMQFIDLSSRKIIGLIAWFNVHANCFGAKNTLINGDTKGFAEQMMERSAKADQQKLPLAKDLVAAFALGAAGDMSPRIDKISWRPKHWTNKIKDFVLGMLGADVAGKRMWRNRYPDATSAADNGRSMHHAARELSSTLYDLFLGVTSHNLIHPRHADTAQVLVLSGPAQARTRYQNFGDIDVSFEMCDGRKRVGKTCPATLGVSFIGGTEDGVGFVLANEGDHMGFTVVKENNLTHHPKVRTNLATKILTQSFRVRPETRECQLPKRSLMETAVPQLFSKKPVTPQVLPLQILRVGQFVTFALPFETTTMAGRRVRLNGVRALTAGLKPDRIESRAGQDPNKHWDAERNLYSTVTAPANAYSGYVTTLEEYRLQHYEGGATYFGKYQLAAAMQVFAQIGKAMSSHRVDAGEQPEFMKDKELHSLVWNKGNRFFDSNYRKIGKVRTQPKGLSDKEHATAVVDPVKVEYYCGHPRRRFEEITSFCDVVADSTNTTIATDDSWELRFLFDLKKDRCTCIWRPSSRAYHVALMTSFHFEFRGFKKALGRAEQPFHGRSDSFRLRGPKPDVTGGSKAAEEEEEETASEFSGSDVSDIDMQGEDSEQIAETRLRSAEFGAVREMLRQASNLVEEDSK
eukprot:TRINITY_DN66864_c9_g7_i2.p1 TRINITY_DN66864_c9_g7~~TRINITY_DN66864_c9_g7_i2.p1  ORF type:complete len:632 (-),score=294.63 TRINITY_DN66864_c9_g7_i2:1505-3400(-)